MAIPAINVLGNPNVTEGNFQLAIEDLRKSVIGSGKAYDSANTYSQYDTCVYNGVVYYSKINSNTGNTPAVGSNWGLVSELIKLIASPTTNAVPKINADGTLGNSGIVVDANNNIGVGVAPSAWYSLRNVIELPYGTSIGSYNGGGGETSLNHNATTIDNTTWKYKLSGSSGASRTIQDGTGSIKWQTAPSGTAGNTITWNNVMSLSASGVLTCNSSQGGLGYGTGAGGTVTQLTSKSASVTLNKPSGNIITHNSALSAGQVEYIQLYNSLITVNDLVYVTADFGAARYTILPYVYSSGGVTFSIKNEESVTRSDAVTIKFIVIKGANS